LLNQAADSVSDMESEATLDLENPLAPQMLLQQRIARDSSATASIVELPNGCSSPIWQLANIRELTKELNLLAVALDGICTPSSCPVMNATDSWHYLCAAHKSPKECCAIDYTVHTLEGTSAMLNSTKYFPSRSAVPKESLKYFQSIARRLYRILAHAYFHHRAEFDAFEEVHHVHERFVALGRKCQLIPDKLLVHNLVPKEVHTAPEDTGF